MVGLSCQAHEVKDGNHHTRLHATGTVAAPVAVQACGDRRARLVSRATVIPRCGEPIVREEMISMMIETAPPTGLQVMARETRSRGCEAESRAWLTATGPPRDRHVDAWGSGDQEEAGCPARRMRMVPGWSSGCL